MTNISRRGFLAAAAASLLPTLRAGEREWTDADQEEFLRKAEPVAYKELSTGVTRSRKVTLTKDGVTAAGHFQVIDAYKAQHRTLEGLTELNFRDCWRFNVAAYKLDRLLGLHMTPVSVERRLYGSTGALTWWIPNCKTEADRRKQGERYPDPGYWADQMAVVTIFDELIHNTDRNPGNLLINADWRIWMIDHTRAFRRSRELQKPNLLLKCERGLMARLKEVADGEVRKALGEYVSGDELKALLARRRKIVEALEGRIREFGESAVLYEGQKLAAHS